MHLRINALLHSKTLVFKAPNIAPYLIAGIMSRAFFVCIARRTENVRKKVDRVALIARDLLKVVLQLIGLAFSINVFI